MKSGLSDALVDSRPRQISMQAPVLSLVRELCHALATEKVQYCHWKSNNALDRSANGSNDLDLLVYRPHWGRYTEIISRLGFKEARMHPKRELPGIFHHYGLDRPAGRFVHLHSQTQLVLGDDTTKNYRLPMEGAYLASAEQGPLFRVPAPEYELAVFVVRMVLKHATWDAIGYGRGRLGASERRELNWLEDRADPVGLGRIVRAQMPYLTEELWQACRRCLRPDSTKTARILNARALREALAECTRLPPRLDTALRVWRRASWGAQRHLLRRPPRKRLATGGALIGVVGGDGAGKSSVVEALGSTLSQTFATTVVHLGKPPESLATLALKGPIRVANRFGYLSSVRLPAWSAPTPDRTPPYAWLVWHALSARDRRLAYGRARRFASRGGLVVCDRFPLHQLRTMDGARIQHVLEIDHLPRTARMLAELERRSYSRISHPDVLVVLRVDPATAVARRPDQAEELVRRRNEEVSRIDWTEIVGFVIDAGQQRDVVWGEALSAAWSRL